MIGSFKNYLVEEEREVFFTFGRMNPPTIGHQKLLDKLASVAGRMPYFVYLSQSQDSKKNPLDYKTKVKTVRKMFPRHARSIILEKSCKNAMECAVKLYNQGYKNITMVVGQDRMREFDVLLKKYNGQKARHGFYNFNKINDHIHSSAKLPSPQSKSWGGDGAHRIIFKQSIFNSIKTY